MAQLSACSHPPELNPLESGLDMDLETEPNLELEPDLELNPTSLNVAQTLIPALNLLVPPPPHKNVR